MPDAGHDLRVDGSHDTAEEVGVDDAHAQLQGDQIGGPGQHTAHGADQDTGAVDVEVHGKAHAAHEAAQVEHEKAVVHQSGSPGDTPETCGEFQCRCSAQCNGHRDQQNQHQPVQAGIGVAVHHIAHGVGEQQARHQDHQSADDGGIRVLDHAHAVDQVDEEGHAECGDNGAEKLRGAEFVHEFFHSHDDEAAQTGTQGVGEGAAEGEAESEGRQEKAHGLDEGGIAAPVVLHVLQPVQQLRGFRMAVADGPAQIAVHLHGVQIVAVGADAAHPGHGISGCGDDADGQAVGDGEGLGIVAVGFQYPLDGLLHTECLGAGHGQTVAQCGGSFQKQSFVHGVPSFVSFGRISIPIPGGFYKKKVELS